MPPLSYKNDHDEDERLNPTSLRNSEQQTGQNTGVNAGIDQAESYANDPTNASKNVDDVKNREETSTPPSGWKSNVSKKSNQPTNLSRNQKVARIFKKKGAGVGVGLGLTGVIISMFLGLVSNLLPVNLLENFSRTNDSSSTAMERRFLKVFGNAVEPENPICKSNKNAMKCKMGRISNSALKKLEKKGIRANPAPTKRTGYPSANPKSYTFDMGNGKTKTVQAKDMRGFLVQPENKKLASKILGPGGAFNMRFSAWIGKHINNKFYKAFNLKRDGGIADGKDTDTNSKTRYASVVEKMQSRLPGNGDTGEISADVESKVNERLNKARKGGPAYLGAVVSCVTPKIPRYIAGGVAAIQLAQLITAVQDTALSPGSKAKATGVQDTFTAGDAETVGTLFTEQTPRESDGKMTSALDSPILLAAMGANTGKPAVSEKFAPGYSMLTNKAVLDSVKADEAAKPVCDKVLSPQAMYAAAGADAAITIALSATVIGGIIKVAGSWALSSIITAVVANLTKDAVTKALTNFAENDDIKKARGEQLGDIVGLGAAGFFSAGGMARHLPTLTQSQLAGYEDIKRETEEERRALAVASLSPFDISSPYTFLGSIIHNTQTAMIANGSYNGSLSSLATTAFSLPITLAFPGAQADSGLTEDYCGYADEFMYEYQGDAPAINMAGLPCTGLTPEQDQLDTDTSIDLVTNEEWYDETQAAADDATIDELVESGYIKSDTPLSDYIEACSNASTGDYVFNSGSCTLDSTTSSGGNASNINDVCIDTENADGQTVTECANTVSDSAFTGSKEVDGIKDARSIPAMANSLLDYQVLQSFNGEDEEPIETNTAGLTGGSDFTMMTYNIERTENKDVYKKSAEIIKNSGASVISLQEMGGTSQATLKEYLGSNYKGYPSNSEGKKLSQLTPVYWDTTRFEKTDQGIVEYPWSLCSGVDPCAAAPWVKLRDIETQQELYAISIHMTNKRRKEVQQASDPGGAFQRERSAQLLNEFAKKNSDAPVFVGGDFNSTWGIANTGDDNAIKNERNRIPYCVMTKSTFDNAYDLAQGSGDKTCPTKVGDKAYEIDHIYSSRGYDITASNYKELSEAKGLSDPHLPITVNYSIPGAEIASGEGTEFTIATYNQKKSLSASAHAAAVKNIVNNKFDVVGTQETGPPKYDRYINELKKENYGVYPTNGANSRTCAAYQSIFYNKSKFSLIKGETFDFPRYPDDPANCGSTGATSGNKSSAPKTWTQAPIIWLKDTTKDQTIIVINTHNVANVEGAKGTNPAKSREIASDIYIAQIKRLKRENPGIPIFLTGDFNEGTGVRNERNRTLDGDYKNLLFCKFADNKLMKAIGETMKCPTGGSGVDFIYTTPEVEVESVKTLSTTVAKSDHKTIYAKVIVPGKELSGEAGWPTDPAWYKQDKTKFLSGHLGGGSFTSGGYSVDINKPGTSGDGDCRQPVYAMYGGKVSKGDLGGGNGGLIIDSKVDGGTLRIAYAHGPRPDGKSEYSAGDKIMSIGNLSDKYSMSCHIHIDMTYNGKGICPQDIFLALGKGQKPNLSALASKGSSSCGRL